MGSVLFGFLFKSEERSQWDEDVSFYSTRDETDAGGKVDENWKGKEGKEKLGR
jgi:hypothetical protein